MTAPHDGPSRRHAHTATTPAAELAAVPFPVPVVGLAWHRDAVCLREGFAPGTFDERLDGERAAERRARIAIAQAACARCPVAQRCLDDHLSGYGGGIRAGYVLEDASNYTHTERAPARDPLPREPAECGTPRGARSHRWKGEEVCADCRRAELTERAARARQYRAEARQRREAEAAEAAAVLADTHLDEVPA